MTWISAGSVRGSYLNLFAKTRGGTQMPQECNLSFIPITSRFNKLRQHWNIPPLSGWRKVTGLRAKIMKTQLKVLCSIGMVVVVLVNFFNLLVKIWKKRISFSVVWKNKKFTSLSLILTGPVQSKEGENKSKVEQAKVKIPHRACNELSNHQINNAEHWRGGVMTASSEP